ncbi:ATP-binding cassette domain-containing protein [Anaerolineae bacterium CFX8]|nr:ATP-binding cassette domain-containing protein [Anaerolineae bacterium CFX8]
MDIELRHIHKHFGPVHANNDISLSFRGGRIVGILGENGAGKSTLMKILSGFQPMDGGEIYINGARVDYTGPQAAIRHGVGMLQQDPLDVAAFTVLENFIYGQAGGLALKRREGRARLEQICSRFGFSLDAETPIAQLSIGQRQQLEIVRLLSQGVKTLILDEPTTGISAEQKTILFNALRDLAARDGMCILLVSHKLEDVIALCDEVAVLRGGRLVGTRDMPATTGELVAMMFGQELPPQTRQPLDLEGAETALALENLTLRGKRVTIENLSLQVRAGEIVGLAGLDGSGQEMLLRACVGLIKPAHGRVIVGGENLTGAPYRAFLARGVAFGAAGRLEEGLVAGLSLTEHIALAHETGALVDWPRARRHTEEQLRHYNVRGRPESRVETLSGGNQQRLLMALMPPRPLLMALEQPTRGLDVDSSRWIWQQLLARRANGTAILFSSAELDELVAYSDRILVFYAGRVFEIPDASRASIDELGRLIGGHFDGASEA